MLIWMCKPRCQRTQYFSDEILVLMHVEALTGFAARMLIHT